MAADGRPSCTSFDLMETFVVVNSKSHFLDRNLSFLLALWRPMSVRLSVHLILRKMTVKVTNAF